MTLTDSTRNLLLQALAMAASRYVEIAADVESMPGGDRLSRQFVQQAIETRTVAILMGDADSISILGVGDREEAHNDARRVTAQEVIDVRNSRDARPKCPHCGSPVGEEGCSNGLCEAVA
jgi:hypothetical protein